MVQSLLTLLDLSQFFVVTEQLIRKRAEHNEGEISTLEELTLHQQNIERITHLDSWCRKLKILYIHNNLIPRLENLGRLKELEYLNISLNNIEKIENLEGCESLKKLDLTVNFIGLLTSIESLKGLIHLQDLYLTGNPCAEFTGYREFVIATLPQLLQLDGKAIEKRERIAAEQNYPKLLVKIVQQEEEYLKKRAVEKEENLSRMKHRNERIEREGSITKEIDSEFWQEKVPFSPEFRIEAHQFTERKEKGPQKKQEVKRERPLFSKDGNPLNINEAKLKFRWNDEEFSDMGHCLVLTVSLFKHLDTSMLDCDLNPQYVRLNVKGKIFQLALPEEVNVERSSVRRSQITGELKITMPTHLQRVTARSQKPGVPKIKNSEQKENFLSGEATHWLDRLKITDCRENMKTKTEISKQAAKERPNDSDFEDDLTVPELC